MFAFKRICRKQKGKRSEGSFLFFCKDARGNAGDLQSHTKKRCIPQRFSFYIHPN